MRPTRLKERAPQIIRKVQEAQTVHHSLAIIPTPTLRTLYDLEQQLESALYRGEGYLQVPQSLAVLSSFNHLIWSAQNPCPSRGLAPTPAPLRTLYRRFEARVRHWHEEFDQGAPLLAAEILYFLRRWLAEHQQRLQALNDTRWSQVA